jgi:seryl-tRNA(Sec) selenium transferase
MKMMITVIMRTFKNNKKQRKNKERREQKYSMTKKLKMILPKALVPMKMKETKSLKVLRKSSLREPTMYFPNLNTDLVSTSTQLSKNLRRV